MADRPADQLIDYAALAGLDRAGIIAFRLAWPHWWHPTDAATDLHGCVR